LWLLGLGKVCVSYDDLLELARLCLRGASLARTPAAASELRRLAEEYQARAADLSEGLRGTGQDSAAGAAAPVQQQQQPQRLSDPGSVGTSIGLQTEAGQKWRERAEDLRARAALLEDGSARLVMLHIAECYEAFARRAGQTFPSTSDGKD
jgi:hypothetical protein